MEIDSSYKPLKARESAEALERMYVYEFGECRLTWCPNKVET